MTASRLERIRHGLAERRAAHRRRSLGYRVVFAVAGATVTVAGVAMLALPGPAFVVIPIGLGMLAMEFAWAERMLHKALDRAEAARVKAASTSRTERALVALTGALAVGAAVAAAVHWDNPYVPV